MPLLNKVIKVVFYNHILIPATISLIDARLICSEIPQQKAQEGEPHYTHPNGKYSYKTFITNSLHGISNKLKE